jgi:Transposase
VNSEKYIGMDVHQATISVAVMDSGGKLVMESILETKAATILQFVAGLRGTLCVTFEEGTCAAWLYDLLNPHVAKLVVCNPRKNALLKYVNKSDRIDARKLAELLRGNHLKQPYCFEGNDGELFAFAGLWDPGTGFDAVVAGWLPPHPASHRTDSNSAAYFTVDPSRGSDGDLGPGG